MTDIDVFLVYYFEVTFFRETTIIRSYYKDLFTHKDINTYINGVV